jgi:hypothetical protein
MSQIVIDSAQNSISVGTFAGTTDFDPGAGNTNTTCMGYTDCYIRKLSPSGSLIWVKTFGANYNQFCSSVNIDKYGNIYATGSFCSTVDFDPGPGTLYKSSVINNLEDIFIIKLDPNGNLLWVKTFGGNFPNNDRGIEITTDKNGDVYVTGIFKDSIDFDPGPNTHIISSKQQFSDYLLKLNSNGDYLWLISNVNNSMSLSTHIKTDNQNNIYYSSTYRDSIDMDPSPNTSMLHSNGGDDFFIQKLSSNGQLIWAKSFGSSLNDHARILGVNKSNEIVISCAFRNTMDMNPNVGIANAISNGNEDICIINLDSIGNYIWGLNFGGVQQDFCTSIAFDSVDNIYTTGHFQNIVDFDPSNNNFILTSNGISDAFIQKIDKNGNFKWAKSIGGNNYNAGYSIAIDHNQNIIAQGTYTGLADFDPNAGVFNLDTTVLSMYTLKWSQCNIDTSVTLSGITITASQSNATYQWIKCNPISSIAGANLQSYTPTVNGDYAVVISQNGCIDTSECIKVTGVGVDEINPNSIVQIYPNPSDGNYTIDFKKTIQPLQLQLVDITGRIILSKRISNINSTKININNASGLYFLNFTLDNVFYSFKLVKE